MDLVNECVSDEPLRSIVLNVGGVVDPDHLVGRGRELSDLDQAITTSEGALLVGDRRMGKTSLSKKLAELLEQRGHNVIRISAQTTKPEVLATRIRTELGQNSTFRKELDKWSAHVEVTKFGVTLKRTPLDKNAKQERGDLFEWAAETAGKGQLIVIIDELAAFLQSFDDLDAATEFMSSLRVVRQNHANVTMVFAGSIGLHHVIPPGKGLTNDLIPISVGSLEPCDAYYLARCLIAETQLNCKDEKQLAAAIATEVDFIPFYIHFLIQQLLSLEQLVDVDDVGPLLGSAFEDPLDPLDFAHYRDRLEQYYGSLAAVSARALDHYALDGELSIEALAQRLAADELEPRPSRDELTGLIEGLERDHYIERRPGGSNEFASKVLRQGWLALRRLN